MVNWGKVIVIGLDGADYELIKNLAGIGELPTFKRLFNEGSYGRLQATAPPFTCPSWTSITTGVNPGKHGIFDFAKYDKFLKMSINTSKDVKVPRVWDILGKYGLKSIVVNCPVSYPANKINGVLISGMDSPELNAKACHPKAIYDFLRRENYCIDIDHRKMYEYRIKNPYKLVDELNRIAINRFRLSLKLMKKFEWDFAFILFNESDRVLHYCFDDIKLIKYHFKLIDNLIGKIIETYSHKTTILIVSDHGFDILNYKFYPNSMLKDLKLLQLKEECSHIKLPIWIYSKIPSYKLLNTLFNKFLSLPILDKKVINMIKTSNNILDIVLPNSIAVYPPPYSQGGIRINDVIDNKKDIINTIINHLRDINDSSERPILEFFKKEDVYEGNMISKAPDIVIMPKSGITIDVDLRNSRLLNNQYLSKIKFLDKSGDHASVRSRNNAMLFIYGKDDIQKEVRKATVMDITPMILELFDLELPKYMDGEVLI